MWRAAGAAAVAALAAWSLGAPAARPDLAPLDGMDDEAQLRSAAALLRRPSWRALLRPAPPELGLGVYEPVALAARAAALAARGGWAPSRAVAALSLALHGLNAALSLRLALAVCASRGGGGALGALASAAFFGAHPMRAEAVCWASGQSYVLAGTWCLACLLRRLRGGGLLLEAALYALAVGSKAAAVPLPLVLELLTLLLDAPCGRWSPAAALRRLAALAPIGLSAVALAAHSAGDVPVDARTLSWSETVLRASFAVCFYIRRSLQPWRWTTPRLAVPGDLRFMLAGFGLSFACAAALTAASVAVVLGSLLRARGGEVPRTASFGLSVAWLAYSAMLLPSLGLASGGHIWALAADRYSYLPSLCVLVPLTAVLADGAGGCRGAAARAAIACALFAVVLGTALHARDVAALWAGSSRELFEAVLREQPEEFSMLRDLGTLHARPGGDLELAEALLSRAARLRPGHPGALLNLATVLHRRGRLREAERHYVTALAGSTGARRGIAERTELAKLTANYGALLLQGGRVHEAAELLEPGAPWPGLPASARRPALLHLAFARRALSRGGRASEGVPPHVARLFISAGRPDLVVGSAWVCAGGLALYSGSQTCWRIAQRGAAPP